MFKILSLDGGGIRGAFTAACLAEWEKQLGGKLGDYFDLIAGTSTGGIIAAGLAAGLPAEKIVEFYRGKGAAIFLPRGKAKIDNFWLRLVSPLLRREFRNRLGIEFDDLFQCKYDADALEESLVEVFGDQVVGDVRGARLLLPSIDTIVGRTTVFKTPHLPGLTRDRHFKIVDVLRATTAAPTYFPQATFSRDAAYVDGGLWANNPGMVAYAEAIKIRECMIKATGEEPFRLDDIRVLSLGTGEFSYSHSPPANGPGIGYWVPKIADLMSISQSQGVHFQLQYLLGSRYHRTNFQLPDSSWQLDNVARLTDLMHVGRTRAHDDWKFARDPYFKSTVTPYVPFTEQELDLEEKAA